MDEVSVSRPPHLNSLVYNWVSQYCYSYKASAPQQLSKLQKNLRHLFHLRGIQHLLHRLRTDSPRRPQRRGHEKGRPQPAAHGVIILDVPIRVLFLACLTLRNSHWRPRRAEGRETAWHCAQSPTKITMPRHRPFRLGGGAWTREPPGGPGGTKKWSWMYCW